MRGVLTFVRYCIYVCVCVCVYCMKTLQLFVVLFSVFRETLQLLLHKQPTLRSSLVSVNYNDVNGKHFDHNYYEQSQLS